MGLLLCLAAWFSARNKLAFKIEVSDLEIQRLYDQYVSNPSAMRALAYGVLSLIVPLIAPLSLGFGIYAMSKEQRSAWPPVGGRRAALIGIVVSGFSLVVWIGIAVAVLVR